MVGVRLADLSCSICRELMGGAENPPLYSEGCPNPDYVHLTCLELVITEDSRCASCTSERSGKTERVNNRLRILAQRVAELQTAVALFAPPGMEPEYQRVAAEGFLSGRHMVGEAGDQNAVVWNAVHLTVLDYLGARQDPIDPSAIAPSYKNDPVPRHTFLEVSTGRDCCVDVWGCITSLWS